eukprot:m.259283 g.259283  ORF g.259283 m.259283 type:complete len:519 (+) comp37856_c0_seq1:96-1652(+)
MAGHQANLNDVLSMCDCGFLSNTLCWASAFTFGLLWLLRTRIGTRPADVRKWKGGTRPLGLLERWYSASHETEVMHNFCVVVHGSTTNPTSLDRSIWEQALRRTLAQLPFLRVTIVDDDVCPYFQELGDIDVGAQLSFVTRYDDDSWARVAERENGMGFGYGKVQLPLWRVVLVVGEGTSPDFELIVTVHHGVCDGRAAMYVARTVLQMHAETITASLCNTNKSDPMEQANLPVETCSLPALDNLEDTRPTVGYVLKLLFETNFLKGRGGGWRGNPATLEERTGRLLSGHLDVDVGSKLFARCHTEKVSVTALVVAASQVASAWACRHQENDGDNHKQQHHDTLTSPISFALPVDLRTRMNARPPLSMLGACVCEVAGSSSVSLATDVWELARHVDVWNDPALVLKGLNTIGVLGFAGKLRPRLQQLRSKEPAGRTCTVSVSSLGRVDLGTPHQSISVKMARHAQLKLGEGPVFNVMVTTTQGVLAWSAAYVAPNISHTQAQVFRQKFTELLHKSASA